MMKKRLYQVSMFCSSIQFNSVQFNSALDSTCLFSDRYKTKQPALITAI